MGLRFRRSVRLMPGVRMNFSRSGASLSLGPRGASVTIGKRGTYANLGLPGTGLSARHKLSGGGRGRARKPAGSQPAPTVPLDVTTVLDDDGSVSFRDGDGQPLAPNLVRAAKEQQGDTIRVWLHSQAQVINDALDQVVQIHQETPGPDQPLDVTPAAYNRPPPRKPEPVKLHLVVGLLFRAKKRRVDAENAERLAAYNAAMQAWAKLKQAFEAKEATRIAKLRQHLATDTTVMEDYLSSQIDAIAWPRETAVSFEVLAGGEQVAMDVDLPEIEDMPTRQASVPERGWRLSIKDVSDTQTRKHYMMHIHGVLFRLTGEVFARLPSVRQVMIAGYSQRLDPKVGGVTDEYLISARIPKADWQRVNFDNLSQVDPVQAFERFDLRRKMTKTGIFKAIQPYTATEPTPAASER